MKQKKFESRKILYYNGNFIKKFRKWLYFIKLTKFDRKENIYIKIMIKNLLYFFIINRNWEGGI